MSKEVDSTFIYIIVLGMLCAFGPICTDIYLPALPNIATYFQASASQVQLSLTTSFLGLAVGQIIIGPLSDIYGRRPLMLIFLVCFVLSSYMCANATSIEQLIIFRFLQGISGASGIVLSRAIACDLYAGSQLTRFMSMLMSVNSIAPIVGPILGSMIIVKYDFKFIFYFLCLWGVILFILHFIFIKESANISKSDQHALLNSLKSMYKELKNKNFMLLVLSMSCIMGGFFSYLSASSFVFQRIYAYSSFAYALVFSVNAILISLLAILAGRLSKVLGDIKIVRLSIYVMIIVSFAAIAIAFIKPQSSIFILLALSCFVPMIGSSQTAAFAIVMGQAKGAKGSASGIFGVGTFVLGAICSPLVGLLGEMSMIPLAIIMLCSSVLALILFNLVIKN